MRMDTVHKEGDFEIMLGEDGVSIYLGGLGRDIYLFHEDTWAQFRKAIVTADLKLKGVLR